MFPSARFHHALRCISVRFADGFGCELGLKPYKTGQVWNQYYKARDESVVPVAPILFVQSPIGTDNVPPPVQTTSNGRSANPDHPELASLLPLLLDRHTRVYAQRYNEREHTRCSSNPKREHDRVVVRGDSLRSFVAGDLRQHLCDACGRQR